MPNLNHRFFGMSKGAGGTMNTRKKVFIACMLTTIVAPAYALRLKCVALTSDTICPDASFSGYGMEFTANCQSTALGSRRVPVTVIGMCAGGQQTVGTAQADSAFLFGSSTSTSQNGCWCKVISPVRSKWVSAGGCSGDNNMTVKCLSLCAQQLAVDNATTFTKAIFSNLY